MLTQRLLIFSCPFASVCWHSRTRALTGVCAQNGATRSGLSSLAPTYRIMLGGILWHRVPIVASKSKTVGVGSHPSLNLHHVCPFTRAPCPIRFRFFPFAFASFATSPFALLGCRGPCDGVRMRTMQELCGSPSTACARKQSLLSTSRPCRPAHKRLILVDALFDTTAFFAF